MNNSSAPLDAEWDNKDTPPEQHGYDIDEDRLAEMFEIQDHGDPGLADVDWEDVAAARAALAAWQDRLLLEF